jgi:hypothetical protein
MSDTSSSEPRTVLLLAGSGPDGPGTAVGITRRTVRLRNGPCSCHNQWLYLAAN